MRTVSVTGRDNWPRSGSPVRDAELAEPRQAELRAQVGAEAPRERKGAAVERIDELEGAVIADEPDLTTVEYIKRWFARNVPRLAGTVTGVIVNPSWACWWGGR